MRRTVLCTLLSLMCFCPSHAQTDVPGQNTNCHDYVDMGLSVLWATCNVGATRPHELGNYYAWGEINPKNKFKPGNYKYYKLSVFKNPNLFGGGLEKYEVSKYGISNNEYDSVFDKFNDGKMVLERVDDVASVEYGHGWSLPSIQDYEELFENCKCDRVTIDGINCIRLTSNISGYENNYVIFPISGAMSHSSLTDKNKDKGKIWDNQLLYWTSCLSKDLNSKHAVALHANEKNEIDYWNLFRFYGLPVRAIINK